MRSGTTSEIGGWIRALIYSVLKREELLWSCCPKMAPDAHQDAMQEVHVADKGVSLAVKKLRATTGNRLAEYTAEEVILICFLLSSIWHDARDLGFRSSRLGDLVGRHKPKALAELAESLISGTSPVLSFATMKWNPDLEPAGCYGFQIVEPKRLQKLLFGNAVEME